MKEELVDLQAGFKASRESSAIAANRKLIETASDAIRLAQTVVSALSRMNHELCRHEGSRPYTDMGGGSCTYCPHCGGD